MQERTDKVSRNDPKNLSDRDKAMSDIAYAKRLMDEAFPPQRFGNVQAALLEAYRFMKPKVEPRIERPFTFRRVRSLHEGSARRVDGAEMDALKLAQIEEARREHRELRARLAHLEEALAMADAAPAGAPVGAYRSPAGAVGGEDRARTER